MKKLQVISNDVQPVKPTPNMLVVIDDKIIHYDNNGNPFVIKSEDQGQVSVEWSDVLNKPATFTPSSHSHSYSEITGKPSTFTPSAHTHAWAEITGKPALLTIGTTASTAKAGNYTPSATEVLAAINNMTPEQLTELKTLLGITLE